MSPTQRNLLSQLEVFTPPGELVLRILARVEVEKRRVARMRLAIFGFLSIGSTVALVPIARYGGEEFARSGFIEYFSLLFSDTATVLPYWKEFALSLAESLPVVEVIIFATVTLVLLSSLSVVAKNIHNALFTTQSLRYG